MPLHIEPHAEPIPGYRLIERLGSGGFGEVWKAEAPGGLFKAIKFVQRSAPDSESIIGNSESDRSRADQEWKSLIRVKTVRHPFILLLDRFENIENYLVIVMELADRTLADRFKECRSQGLPGVPREELLGYLAEAAEVLDLMSSQYQLQHLDIKPQNLFLVHQHIKVADFGLVKDTTAGKSLMTITGGVTPVYAAPETFDGQFSRHSDQYSLAIVYQEMLTGQRPFTGTTMKQLVLQHLQTAHDLTPAPVHDRPILARALTKNPEDRYANCLDFINALKAATGRASGPPEAPSRATVDEKSSPTQHKTLGTRGSSGPVQPAEPNFSVGAAFLRAPNHHDVPNPSSTPSSIEKSSRVNTVAHRGKSKEESPAGETGGIVQPALIVGLGQLGAETLLQVRQHIARELGTPNAVPQVHLLAIDTDPEAIARATQGNLRTALRTQEAVLARLQRPSHYLKSRDGKLPTDTWLNSRLLHRIPREQNNAGLRALGRLAFVDNYRAIARRLELELQALCAQDTPHEEDERADLGVRTTQPRVYVVTSLAGNTGGGMFVDVAYLLRSLLNQQGHADAEIVGFFYVPQPRRDGALLPAMANAYAALVELKHYCQPEAIFSAHYETAASQTKGERVAMTGSAFQRCFLLPLPDPKGKPNEADNSSILAQAGSFLYRDLATTLGQAFDQERKCKLVNNAETAGAAPFLQSLGTYRIHWPRHELLGQAGRRLCTQLVTGWLNKDAAPIADSIRQWTAERWESLGMRPENLIDRFQQLAENSLGQRPELTLAEILAPVQQAIGQVPSPSAKGKSNLHLGSVVQAMERLERMLGIPDTARTSKLSFDPSAIERAMAEIAENIADECEQKLAELAVHLLEDPAYRLAGAEEALRQFSTTVEQSLQSQEPLAKELTEKTDQLYQRIHQLLDAPLQTASPTQPQWIFGLGRRAPASLAAMSGADVFELVRTYTKTRYHSLVLAHLNRLYVALRGHLSDQIREVGFCRQRLGELRGLLQPVAEATRSAPAGERQLFPPGCIDLQDAVNRISEAITPADLLDFDQRVQVWINDHCEALLQVCMGSAGMLRSLAPAMLQEAENYLDARLAGSSVADMYLVRKRVEHGDQADDRIIDDLQRCLGDATPSLGRIADANEITIVTVPDDEPGRHLRDLLQRRQKNVRIILSRRQEEIVFYHELVRIPWQDLDPLGPVAREAYERRLAADPQSLHTREDVFDWQTAAAVQ